MRYVLVCLVVLAVACEKPESTAPPTVRSGSHAFCDAQTDLSNVIGDDISQRRPDAELVADLSGIAQAFETEGLPVLASATNQYRTAIAEGGDRRTASTRLLSLFTEELPAC